MNILYTNFHQDAGYQHVGTGGGHNTYIISLLQNPEHKKFIACPNTSSLYKAVSGMPQYNNKLFHINFSSKLSARIKEAVELKKIIEENDIDIVHTNGSRDTWILIYAKLLSKKKFKVVHTKHNSIPSRFSSKIRYNYLCDALIFVSKSIFDTLNKEKLKIPIHVIENGVDTDFWNRSTAAKAPGNVVKIISNAGTSDYKRWDNIVNAILSLPKKEQDRIELTILGNLGDTRQIDPNYHVSFPGFQPSKPYLENADVGFVLSDRTETISFACREMMSMSLPVIVSDFAGLKYNVAPGTGWITKTNDIGSIAQALKEILHMPPEQLLKMKQNAREHAVNSFDLKQMIEKTNVVYNELI